MPRNAEIKILFAVARTLLLTPIMPMGLNGLPDPTTLSDALYIFVPSEIPPSAGHEECARLFFSGLIPTYQRSSRNTFR